MSNKWIRKGDKVVVISGNERGQMGNVLRKSEDRVVIEGLNIRKKHVKPKQKMQPGIVEMEAPIHISNVRLCDEQGKPIQIKVKSDKKGKKLYYIQNGKEVVYREVKKKKD